MFDHHRKSPWFAEKYDPATEYVNLRTKTRKEGWKGRESTFLLDLDAGKFDPDFNDPVAEPEPTSPMNEDPQSGENTASATNGNGAAAPATEDAKPSTGDDEMQFNMDAEGEAGDDAADNETTKVEANGKSSANKGERFTRGEEMSVPPEGNQVMIRTIPPDIGRVKLEDVSCPTLLRH